MGKYVTELDRNTAGSFIGEAAADAGRHPVKSRSVWKTVVVTALITIAVVSALGGAGFYIYWQNLKSSPQYSLALLVDAAKRDDAAAVGELVDTDAVVEDFLPQITIKAVELYGRGLPADILQRVARIAAPVMPAVKQRAREELPGAIREKTAGLGNVPFAAMVLGAQKYLDIKVSGETATVKSRLPEHSFELKMKRSGERWKVAGLADEELATRIAQRIGQEIVAVAVNPSSSSRSKLGVKNINELLREAEEIFK